MQAIIVIDCRDKETLNFHQVKAFPETLEGNKAAEACFVDRVSEMARDLLAIEDKAGREEFLGHCLDNGYYEVGDVFVAILHTT